MRTGSGVYCLYSDYLGSTSLAANAGGAIVAEQRYYPYGEVGWVSGTLPTGLTFTGQRNDPYIDMIQMDARWYSGYAYQDGSLQLVWGMAPARVVVWFDGNGGWYLHTAYPNTAGGN